MILKSYKEIYSNEIPKEWIITTLDKYIDEMPGYAFKSEMFFEKPPGIKLVRGDNVTRGKLRWKDKTKYWRHLTSDIQRYFLNEDDILVSMDGSLVGRNYAKIEKNDLPLLLVQRVSRLRTKSGLSSNFIFYHIASDQFIRYVDVVKTVTAIPHISSKDIHNYTIPLPPLPEQHRIATVLGTIDECIEKTEALIAKLKQVKAGLMQDLLTRGINDEGRIRDESTHEFKDTEIGLVPVEWDVVKIEDLLIEKIINGYSGVETTPDSGILTLTLSAVTNNRISREYTKYCEVNPKNISDLWIKRDDIFIGRSNTYDLVGLSAITETNDSFAIFSDLLIRVRINPGLSIPKFISFHLRSDYSRLYFMKNAKGTSGSMKKIDQTIIKNLIVSLPPLKEQKRIIQIISTSDKQISDEEKFLKKLQLQKIGMMKDLLTGKIRIKRDF